MAPVAQANRARTSTLVVAVPSSDRRVGGLFSNLSVDVSDGKILSPKLFPSVRTCQLMLLINRWLLTSQFGVYECEGVTMQKTTQFAFQ